MPAGDGRGRGHGVRSILDGVGQVSDIARDNANRSKDASRHFQNLARQSDALSGLIHQLDGLGGQDG